MYNNLLNFLKLWNKTIQTHSFNYIMLALPRIVLCAYICSFMMIHCILKLSAWTMNTTNSCSILIGTNWTLAVLIIRTRGTSGRSVRLSENFFRYHYYYYYCLYCILSHIQSKWSKLKLWHLLSSIWQELLNLLSESKRKKRQQGEYFVL